MPFFEVTKGHDAYVEYVSIVEADDEDAAWEQAVTDRRASDLWIPNGIVNAFDHCDVFDDRITQVEAVSFDEAVKQLHADYNFTDVRLSPAELDHVRGLVNAQLLVYLGHNMRGGLFDKEKEKLEFLRNLSKTLEPPNAQV